MLTKESSNVLSFLDLPEKARTMIYDELFKDMEVIAGSDETSGELILHPIRLCHAADEVNRLTMHWPKKYSNENTAETDSFTKCTEWALHPFLKITLVNKEIRKDALARLWKKIVTVHMGQPKQDLLVIPNSFLSNVRLLRVPYHSSRRNTSIRHELMPSLQAISMEPYLHNSFNVRHYNPEEIEQELGDNWEDFERVFLNNQDRGEQNTIADRFLTGSGIARGGIDFMYCRNVTFISEVHRGFEEGVRKEHVHYFYDVSSRQCVDSYQHVEREQWSCERGAI